MGPVGLILECISVYEMITLCIYVCQMHIQVCYVLPCRVVHCFAWSSCIVQRKTLPFSVFIMRWFYGVAELEQELTLSDEQVKKLQTENKCKRSSVETVLVHRDELECLPGNILKLRYINAGNEWHDLFIKQPLFRQSSYNMTLL